jgi:hypothetical protein
MPTPAFTLEEKNPAAPTQHRPPNPPAPGQHRHPPAPGQHSGGTPTPHAPPAGSDAVALGTNMSATFRVFFSTAGGPGYLYNPYDKSAFPHFNPAAITVVVSDPTIITKAVCDAKFLELTSGNLQGTCTVTVGYKAATTYVLNVTVSNNDPTAVLVDVYTGL